MMARKPSRKGPAKRNKKLRVDRPAKVKPASKRAAADVKATQGALPQWTTVQIAEAFRSTLTRVYRSVQVDPVRTKREKKFWQKTRQQMSAEHEPAGIEQLELMEEDRDEGNETG